MGVRARSFELALVCRSPSFVWWVQKVSGNNLKWFFSNLVKSDSIAEATLVDATLSSNGTPNSTVAAEPDTIIATYPAPPSAGDSWTFNGTPIGHITSYWGFAAGSGTVQAGPPPVSSYPPQYP